MFISLKQTSDIYGPQETGGTVAFCECDVHWFIVKKHKESDAVAACSLYREESESDEELEWRLLRAGDLDRGLEGDSNIKQSVIYLTIDHAKFYVVVAITT